MKAKALVVYDSAFGNTEQIAQAVARGLKQSYEINLQPVRNIEISDVQDIDLLVIGSPTQGGSPTIPIKDFITAIPRSRLQDIQVAVFDTRFSKRGFDFGLRRLLSVVGYAAGRMAKALQAKGAVLKVSPEGFIVEGKRGPLKSGEVARAATWAKTLLAS